MSAPDDKIEALILRRLKSTQPTSPLSLVEYVQRSMKADHFDVMAAVWRLADNEQVEFTPGRKLRLPFEGQPMTRTPAELADMLKPFREMRYRDTTADDHAAAGRWLIDIGIPAIDDALRALTPSAGHKGAAEEIDKLLRKRATDWPTIDEIAAIIARCCPVDEGCDGAS